MRLPAYIKQVGLRRREHLYAVVKIRPKGRGAKKIRTVDTQYLLSVLMSGHPVTRELVGGSYPIIKKQSYFTSVTNNQFVKERVKLFHRSKLTSKQLGMAQMSDQRLISFGDIKWHPDASHQ